MRKQADLRALAPILQDVKFFKERFYKDNQLNEVDFYEVISGLKYKQVKADTAEIRYGEPGDLFYIILSGVCSFWIPISTCEMVPKLR